MDELKKHWNNTEFLCTMDEEEPHLCHIHLRTIIDTQLSPSFFYFYEKQEGATKAHQLAHKLHSWIWTNIPSLEMIGYLNGECSPLTTCCAKHHEQLATPTPFHEYEDCNMERARAQKSTRPAKHMETEKRS